MYPRGQDIRLVISVDKPSYTNTYTYAIIYNPKVACTVKIKIRDLESYCLLCHCVYMLIWRLVYINKCISQWIMMYNIVILLTYMYTKLTRGSINHINVPTLTVVSFETVINWTTESFY